MINHLNTSAKKWPARDVEAEKEEATNTAQWNGGWNKDNKKEGDPLVSSDSIAAVTVASIAPDEMKCWLFWLIDSPAPNEADRIKSTWQLTRREASSSSGLGFGCWTFDQQPIWFSVFCLLREIVVQWLAKVLPYEQLLSSNCVTFPFLRHCALNLATNGRFVCRLSFVWVDILSVIGRSIQLSDHLVSVNGHFPLMKPATWQPVTRVSAIVRRCLSAGLRCGNVSLLACDVTGQSLIGCRYRRGPRTKKKKKQQKLAGLAFSQTEVVTTCSQKYTGTIFLSWHKRTAQQVSKAAKMALSSMRQVYRSSAIDMWFRNVQLIFTGKLRMF